MSVPGEFQNYNPPGRKEAWRETHNAPIQVAAETGIFGFAAFMFLVVRAGLARADDATAGRTKPKQARAPDLLRAVMTDADRARCRPTPWP